MWEIVCPACKKRKPAREPLPESPAPGTPPPANRCRRCGCELDLLVEITEAAASAYDRARQLLNSERPDQALAQLEISWRLRQQPETARLAFLTALAAAAYDRADHWYHLADNPASGRV